MTISEFYFKDRHGIEYPIPKEELMQTIDPYNPDSYLPYLKAMNYPYFEEEWIRTRNCLEEKGGKEYTKYTLNKYISKMNLKGYKPFTWEDNERIAELRKQKLEEAIRRSKNGR